MKDVLITDFQMSDFTCAFQEYFSEMGMQIKNWDALFAEMNQNKNGKNFAILKKKGDSVIGFIQFAIVPAGNCFFDTKIVLFGNLGCQTEQKYRNRNGVVA